VPQCLPVDASARGCDAPPAPGARIRRRASERHTSARVVHSVGAGCGHAVRVLHSRFANASR
jgi:hypothetical protein